MEQCYGTFRTSRECRYYCYVCKKGPEATVTLNRCAACNNVFMCREHRIFLDCIRGSIPTGHGISICCRHTRYTAGVNSWNPKGGYPPLYETSEVKEEEEWLEEDGDQAAFYREVERRRRQRYP
eukprot:1903732-Amphidinium_carterae.1